MEDYIEQQQIHIPMNKLKWDLDGTKFRSRPLDFDKVARHAESLRSRIRPLTCTVWHDEGMQCPSCLVNAYGLLPMHYEFLVRGSIDNTLSHCE